MQPVSCWFKVVGAVFCGSWRFAIWAFDKQEKRTVNIQSTNCFKKFLKLEIMTFSLLLLLTSGLTICCTGWLKSGCVKINYYSCSCGFAARFSSVHFNHNLSLKVNAMSLQSTMCHPSLRCVCVSSARPGQVVGGLIGRMKRIEERRSKNSRRREQIRRRTGAEERTVGEGGVQDRWSVKRRWGEDRSWREERGRNEDEQEEKSTHAETISPTCS